jgi:hypothetical protein
VGKITHLYYVIKMITNKQKTKVMKNTTTFTFNENKDCLVDYRLGLGKQPAVLLKDLIYEVTDLKVEDGIVSFELWDDNGFIGEYSFSDEQSLETQIAGIIEYYYSVAEEQCDSTRQLHSSLWDIVCDELDVDDEDETAGEIFDTIMEQYK